MKAIDWYRALESQRELYGKTVFSLTELCNLALARPASLKVQLGRLIRGGVLTRCAHGAYALPGRATPESLLPYLDRSAYITGLFAMARHNLVTQQAAEITCFTNRRHDRAAIRKTHVGRYRFVCVSPAVYAPPAEGVIAPPEQALCDWILTLRHQSLSPIGLVTFRLTGKLEPTRLQAMLPRYPSTVAREVAALIPNATATA